MKGLLSKNPRKVIFLSSREHTASEKLDALKEEAEGTEGGSDNTGVQGVRDIEEKVEWMKCDLDDLQDVDRASLELRRKCEELGRLDGVSISMSSYFLTIFSPSKPV